MTIGRDNPFEELEELFDRMSREFGREPWGGGVGSLDVDVEDRGDRFVVTADLPGFGKDDIEVTLSDRTLRIDAEREGETGAEPEGEYLRRERRRGSAGRSVGLPEPVDESGVEATYDRGVLTVSLPKRGGGDGKRIEVE